MSIGAILQITSYSLAQMFVGRVIAGIGNGKTAPVSNEGEITDGCQALTLQPVSNGIPRTLFPPTIVVETWWRLQESLGTALSIPSIS